MTPPHADAAPPWPAGPIERFRQVWQALATRLGQPPTRRDLDPVAFPFALGWFMLLEYHRGPDCLRCRLAGNEVMTVFGWTKIRHRWLDTVANRPLARDSADFARRVIDGGRPLLDRHTADLPGRRTVSLLRGGYPLTPLAGEPEMLAIVYQYVGARPEPPRP